MSEAEILLQGDARAINIIEWMEEMKANAVSDPAYFFVSIEDHRRIRRLVAVSGIRAGYHVPRRKLRKCFIRKRQAKISRARQRVLRRLRDDEQAMRAMHPQCRCVIPEFEDVPLDLAEYIERKM